MTNSNAPIGWKLVPIDPTEAMIETVAGPLIGERGDRDFEIASCEQSDAVRTYRPELTKRSPGTHKRTNQEHQAALANAS